MVLDRIYSLPVALWSGYLSQLAQLLLERAPSDRIQALLEVVTRDLVLKTSA